MTIQSEDEFSVMLDTCFDYEKMLLDSDREILQIIYNRYEDGETITEEQQEELERIFDIVTEDLNDE